MGRFFAWLMLVSAFFVFALFFWGMHVNLENTFSFVWNSSPGGDLKIDVVSNSYNYELVYPFFVITLLSLTKNFFMHLEKMSGAYAAILIFNLVAVILMLTSNNFIQLLLALFMTDILAFFMIKNAPASRQYILMNIVADMMLFMVIAIINSRIKSLDIRQILRYNQIGFYPNFVSLCGLTAVFVRFGFFLFHIGICGLREIKLHNLINILFLFSPLTAVILLLKFHIVWQNSPYFMQYLNIVCIVTSVWCFWRSLSADSYKAKIIYLQTMFWALLTEMLRFNGFVWNAYFTSLLIMAYILTEGLYLLYYYNGRRSDMLQLINMPKCYKSGTLGAVVLIILSVTVLADILFQIYNNSNRYYIWLFAVFYGFSVSMLIAQICICRRFWKLAEFPVKFKMFFLGILLLISLVPLRQADLAVLPVYGTTIIFCLCCMLPCQMVVDLYKNEMLKQMQGFNTLYVSLVRSAQLLGRFLLLLIDRLLIEKILVRNSVAMTRSFLRIFRRVNSSRISMLFITVLLIVLAWISFKGGGEYD